MNQNETRTLWISVFSALFAVFLLYSYTQEKSAEVMKKFGAKQRVVVAAVDIAEMQTIDDTMLQTVERPVSFIEPNAISNPEEAVGQVALAPIKKDEQVLQSKVIKPGPVTGLSLQVSPSKRAISIPVDDMRGVSRLLKPGDRIDIIAALDVGKGATQKREIKTIMQDVVILATGQVITNELPRLLEKNGTTESILPLRSLTNFSVVTVEVDPKESQDLIYILSTSPGSLFLTLRHPSDRSKIRLPSADLESVLGKVAPQIMNQQVRVPAALPSPKPAPKKSVKKGPFIDL